MAFGQVNKVEVKSEPVGNNGRSVDEDEEIVQIMWDAVRNTHSTDMQPLKFKEMNYANSFKWSDALKDYVIF